MKRLLAVTAGILLVAMGAAAQAPRQTVQCRPLGPGEFLGPNDSIVGSGDNLQVCSIVLVKVGTPQTAQVVAVPSAPVVAAQAVAASQAAVQAPAPVAPPAPEPVAAPAPRINDGKIRVFVTDRPITEVISMIRGGSQGSAHASGSANGFSASAHESSYVGGIKNDNRGGADPRTLEVSADILEDCHVPNLVVTNDAAAADYFMDFRRQGGKRSTFFIMGGLAGLAISAAAKVDHAALYAANGDLIQIAKARTVKGAVKEVCGRFQPTASGAY